MPRFLKMALAFYLVTAIAARSSAAERGFEFSGVAWYTYETLFGNTIPLDSPVTGRFIYETNSSLTHSFANCDCAGYQQQHISGFWADFGGVLVRADDYVVVIANDVVQPGSDVITLA